MISKAKQFVVHVMPAVIRPIHILWNQVIGFVFLLLALVFGNRSFTGKEPGSIQFTGGAFAILLAWFGISSFLRARKISKS